ncbi:MAG: hypothetical protein ACFCUN_14120 [Hyphomicrobiaceae bacterium]
MVSVTFRGFARLTAVVCVGVASAACSTDGVLTTSSVPPAIEAPRADPVCQALAADIDRIRSDGTIGRLQEASTGRTTTVSVKREALARLAEFDRLNSDYRAKCSKPGIIIPAPSVTTATGAPVAAQTASAAVAPAATPVPAAAPTQANAPAPVAVQNEPLSSN